MEERKMDACTSHHHGMPSYIAGIVYSRIAHTHARMHTYAHTRARERTHHRPHHTHIQLSGVKKKVVELWVKASSQFMRSIKQSVCSLDSSLERKGT